MNNYNSKTLMHYGVLGMHWGVRRYQPYPSNYSGDGKFVGDESSANKVNQKKESNADKIARLIKDDNREVTDAALKSFNKGMRSIIVSGIAGSAIGAGMAAIGLTNGVLPATLGGLTLVDAGLNNIAEGAGRLIDNKRALKKEKEYLDAREKGGNIDKQTGLYTKTKDYTVDEDAKTVNPAFKDAFQNSKKNCSLCTIAYELRRRGYDVIAARSEKGRSREDIGDFFNGTFKNSWTFPGDLDNGLDEVAALDRLKKDGMYKTFSKAEAATLVNRLAEEPVGARGIIGVNWPGGGGHHMAYEVTENGPNIVDAQTGKVYDRKSSVNLLRGVITYEHDRLDNLDMNLEVIKGVAVR